MPRKKQEVPQEVQELTRAEVALELKMAKVYNDFDINKLKPADYNPREEVEPGTRLWNELEASLKEYGFADPIVVNSDLTIIGGHQRWKVAKALGYTKCIISMVDVDKTREKALNIALNKITGNWKEMQLADLLKQIKGSVNPEAMGYNQAEMEAAMNKASAEVKDDDFDIDAELKRPVFSKPGDLWHLGEHRVICGDSTHEETYTKLMGGKKANLVLTDPPYNVNVEETAGQIMNDNMGDSEFHQFLLSAYKCMYANLADDGSIYVWHADTEGINFRTAFKEAGFYLSGCCIWVKDSLVLGRSPYQWRHEPCLFGWKAKGKHQWYGDRKQTTVLEFPKPKSSPDHPTTKPVPLLVAQIKNSTMTNGIVLDSFLGSGSTLIACAETDRVCYGIELDTKFVDVEVKRYIEWNDGRINDVWVERDGQKLTFKEIMKDSGILLTDSNGNPVGDDEIPFEEVPQNG